MFRNKRVARGLLSAGLVAVTALTTASAAQAAWVGSWAASQQTPEPQNSLPAGDLTDATLREVVHLSIGGPRIRIRLSNAFGTEPLTIDEAHVARARSPGSAAIDPASDRPLNFDGRRTVTIPAGAEYWSDPIDLATAPLSNLAVSLYLPTAPQGQTSHPGSHATSFLVHGDHTGEPDLAGAHKVEHWFEVSGVDVEAGPAAGTVVALGDSITDGHGSTTNGDDRWPDDLARRLQAGAATRGMGVLNLGTGGNRVLLDGLGPSALARFDRDVLAQDGVRSVILLEGVNDIGVLTRDGPVSPERHEQMVHALLAGFRQMVEAAHAHGLKMVGATILPFQGSDYYHPAAVTEADRQTLNAWIRAPGHFDAVVDFDLVMRDPARPEHLRPDYDSGDHLHPSPAGYHAMANAISLSMLAR